MALINNLPIYQASIDSMDEGMLRISLVGSPAMLSNFTAYDKEEEEVKYSILNEEEHIIFGVVLRADFPIFRKNKTIGNYYEIYNKEVIKEIAEKYLFDGNQNKVNLMHQEGTEVNGVNMFQLFIKDVERGINPLGFEDIEDGSLFAAFKVNNEVIWEEIKNGTFKGFSLEGYFTFNIVQNEEDAEIDEIIRLIEEIIK